SHALLVAVVVSVLVSLSGVYLSFFIDSAPAPTIVVLFALVFIVAMVISGRKTRQLERQRLIAS
ncbi:MAG: metal ABC transporter permease, partial [Pantoea agglomerans]